MESLIKELEERGVLRTPAIKRALRAVDRADFVLPEHRAESYGNYPLPIGEGQTISQPETVVIMLELLGVKKGDRVLEVGAGSGWQTALLAELVGPKGHVYACEIIPSLKEFGEANVAKYDFMKKGIVTWYARDASKGFAEHAPFDRIIAAASAGAIPPAWKKQLAVGGILVAPVWESVVRVKKTGGDAFEEEEFPGFLFVPLTSL